MGDQLRSPQESRSLRSNRTSDNVMPVGTRITKMVLAKLRAPIESFLSTTHIYMYRARSAYRRRRPGTRPEAYEPQPDPDCDKGSALDSRSPPVIQNGKIGSVTCDSPWPTVDGYQPAQLISLLST